MIGADLPITQVLPKGVAMPALRRSRRRSRCLSTSLYLLAVTAGCLVSLESRLPTRQRDGSAPAIRAYARLPLSFEANRGQTDSQVDFLVRGASYTMFLKPTEAVLAMRSRSLLHMRLVGANVTARREGQEILPGKVNYFRGNDPTRWRVGIPTYARRSDTRMCIQASTSSTTATSSSWNTTSSSRPAPTPEPLSSRSRAPTALELDGEGNLIVQTAAGQLVQRAPRVYQEIDGVKKDIQGRYALQDATAIKS